MCIVNVPITVHEPAGVSGTNIFTALCDRARRQFIAYENTIQLPQGTPVTMLLPVPIPPEYRETLSEEEKDDAGIVLTDMSENQPKFKRFMEKVLKVAEHKPKYKYGSSYGGGRAGMSFNGMNPQSDAAPPPPLKVQSVGSYDVSIAPNLDALSRLQTDVFSLREDVGEMLRKNYDSKNWAFIVCELRKSGHTHPVGFSFPRRPFSPLYIPTLHEHGDGPSAHVNGADWDHNIVALGVVQDKSLIEHLTFGREKFSERSEYFPLRASQKTGLFIGYQTKVDNLTEEVNTLPLSDLGIANRQAPQDIFSFAAKGYLANKDLFLPVNTASESRAGLDIPLEQTRPVPAVFA